LWRDSIVPALQEYIRIPNKSPMFDPNWREHGHMARAVALVESWCRQYMPGSAKLDVITLAKRTPVLLIDIPATGASKETVLLYGHLDKQPEMTGWEPGLGPWTPVMRGERLYGRGGADDGYAAFASVAAVSALGEQGVAHARCVILIEASEESGSPDLPYYIDHLADRLGEPSLVVCLDTGCANYDQLWCTTSLRGLIGATLGVSLLSEGVHSGDASGVVADSFRVLRQLLSRLEDPVTGAIVPADFHVQIPPDRVDQAKQVARALHGAVANKYPLLPGVQPVASDPAELILNRTWRPALTITGAAGLPAIADAGNVSRPFTAVKLSLRLPPTLAAERALERLSKLLKDDPPCGAHVEISDAEANSGWNAPPVADWLAKTIERASRNHFDQNPMYMGEGGSIPFMGMLGEKFPRAQFMISGVLGPGSNAHGPNEFLHIPTARRLTACVAEVLADHAARS
jgi:acetylornithine deacetylase/succinyl-diaminopimelate desuccinylase-like protein